MQNNSKTVGSSRIVSTAACMRVRAFALALLVTCASVLLASSSAVADTPAPGWSISSTSYPTNLVAGTTNAADADDLVLTGINTGGAASSGTITLNDTLPAGITLDGMPFAADINLNQNFDPTLSCSSAGQTVTCTLTTAFQPGQSFYLAIPIDVAASAAGAVTNQANISGGGAPSASTSQPMTITAAQESFVGSPFHAFASSFGSAGAGAGQLSLLAANVNTGAGGSGVAVNDVTGDVYVADTGNERVDEFDSSGNFVRAWGWGVADGAASFETCTTTCEAGSSGSGAGQFTTPTFVAVDNSSGASAGDVYVGDPGDDLVTKFTASGSLVGGWGSGGQLNGSAATGGPFSSIAGIAVDGSGNLFVYDPNNQNWFEFGQDGTADPTVSVGRGTDSTGIGVDSNSNLYKVVGNGNLEQFSSSGSDIGDVTDDQTSAEITGFAIDPATNDLYADDGGIIRHYTGSSLGTCVTTGNCAASDTFGSPQLSPSAAGVAFDPTTNTVLVADPGNNDVAVFGPPPASGPVVTGESAAAISSSATTLSGAVYPNGHDTTYQFQYGTADCATSTCTSVPASPVDIGSGTSAVPVSQTIAVLTAGTTYHYRLVATSSQGTVDGPDEVFTTLPAFGFTAAPGGMGLSITRADGLPDTQAGSHPYQLTVSQWVPFGNHNPSTTAFDFDGTIKDLSASLPAGAVINPNATPTRCTESELENPNAVSCPPSSQIGTATVVAFVAGPYPYYSVNALYNMVPPPGVPAEFGFFVHALGVYEHITGGLNTGGNYSLSGTANDILGLQPTFGFTTTFWGNPSDPSHDPDRGNCAFQVEPSCPTVEPTTTPLLTMPSACSASLTTTASADTWENPGTFVSGSGQWTDGNGNPVGVTGCDKLDFTPQMTLQPTSTAADSASGVDFGLTLPDNESQTGLAEATLKKAVVTLPPGATLNPSAANGLQGCTPDEIQLNSPAQPSCPEAAKVGTVSIVSPLLSDPLTGGVYLATPFNNPFNALAAGYIVAQADGALIKLAGQFELNQQTGQITASFDNNPQLPFTSLKIDFFGGPRGDLATPEACGTYPVSSALTPWSAVDSPTPVPDATPSDSFTIDQNCSIGFAPSATATSLNPQAGAYSPFVVSFSRSDSDQYFSGLSVKLPPGMLANLSQVQECSEAALASISTQPGTGIQEQNNPACPAGSQVGTVENSAGAGDPISIGGKVYLTGPYKGAPYGLAVVVPAIAGPFDLGSIVVRQALYVDPTTAQVTDVSDPFPTILDGIPLRLREVDVELNRPDFTVNPTSCDPMSVSSVFTSTLSVTADDSSRFQVGGCQELGFSPKLKMQLTGKGRTRSGDHPTLTAIQTQGSGQANILSAKVALPLSLALDPNNSQHVCSYDVAQAVHGGAVGCPASTVIGSATAVTPLLSQSLTGKVYLVQGLRCQSGQVSQQGTCPGGQTAIRTLPSLLIPLRGQIALDLRAQTSVNGAQQLVTTFAAIPDAPVSKFTLTITGGRKGILVITGRGRTICGKAQVANLGFGAQSGKTEALNPKIATPACRAVHRHKKRHKHKGGGKK